MMEKQCGTSFQQAWSEQLTSNRKLYRQKFNYDQSSNKSQMYQKTWISPPQDLWFWQRNSSIIGIVSCSRDVDINGWNPLFGTQQEGNFTSLSFFKGSRGALISSTRVMSFDMVWVEHHLDSIYSSSSSSLLACLLATIPVSLSWKRLLSPWWLAL